MEVPKQLNLPVIDTKIKHLGRKYFRKLAEDLCSVQPMDIRNPATNENIFTWTYAKQVFEDNAKMRWEDDGGTCVN